MSIEKLGGGSNVPETAHAADDRIEQEVSKEIEVRTHEVGPLSYALATRAGSNRKGEKNQNQDSGIIGDNYLAVADGMGGHEGGKEASALAVELFKKRFEHQTPLELEKWIEAGERFIRDGISECIRRTAMEKGHEVSGTTFTGAVVELLPVLEKRASIRQVVETGVQNGEASVMIAHVGDSHAYIHRSAGSLELITTDDDCLSDIMHGKLDSNTDANTVHTQIRELQRALDGLEMAEKKRLLTESYNFTSDEIARYEKEGHTIIAALGVVVPDKPFVSFTHLLPGDKLILLSDGLDVLTHAEKEKILQEAIDAEMASQELILQATLKVKQKRVKDDDMTVAILENTYTEEH